MSVINDEIQSAAILCADAFLNSPAYVCIYNGLSDTDRKNELVWLFQKNFDLILNAGKESYFHFFHGGLLKIHQKVIILKFSIILFIIFFLMKILTVF